MGPKGPYLGMLNLSEGAAEVRCRSPVGRYRCKSRKSNGPKNLANLKATVIIQHDARDVEKLPVFPALAK